jgi:hypothetical protein
MELTLSTPALLFPAVSLLLLAYTNRYLAVASLIRNLHKKYQDEHTENILFQIRSLRSRINLIRAMQGLGILCIFLCVLSMFFIYAGFSSWAEFSFGLALIVLMASLVCSLWEIQVSARALSIQLSDIEEEERSSMK